ncbi:MAG TPA: fumarylacetoacetate hydrolase family protein [Vicinamibacterales bacterium]|nr:fumarylacetoacetate hydrolase family protein [Vicinamibacterales bacterium]
MDPNAATGLAREILDAYAKPHAIAVAPSGRDGGLDLATAYGVESAIVGLRRATGHTPVGLKVGYANKAVWRALKLETLVWAHMYDDTVEHAPANRASLAVSRLFAPKIEPEIVFKLARPLDAGAADAAAVLGAVEWVALGFEIIDCVFPDWKVQPADFVAAKGLHARLIVGAPRTVDNATIQALVEALATFKVKLSKDGEVVAEGGGRNSLRSPALCLGELASALSRQAGSAPLAAGALISSGTLTESQPIGPDQAWTASLQGIDLPDLTLRTV